MVKCDICNKKIEELFLGKIKGAVIKKGKNFRYACDDCQKKYKNKLMEKF